MEGITLNIFLPGESVSNSLIRTLNQSGFLVLLTFLVCNVSCFAHPRIALVLTGGGARGMAQIGVLKVLKQNGIQPDIVVGSSVGAIIGGLYAAGYNADEIEQMMTKLNWAEVLSIGDDIKRESLFFAQKQEDDRNMITLRFRDFNFLEPEAIGGNARFSGALQEMIWRSPYNYVTDFDHLRCQFRAVATDLATGTWVSLKEGNLCMALRASASFPLRYAPVRVGDSILVDGGLIANIPVPAARELNPDFVIVVNTTSDLQSPTKLNGAFDVADQALSIAMKQRDTTYLADADVVITPRLGFRSTFDFSNIDSLIRLGEAAGRLAIDHIRRSIGKYPDSTLVDYNKMSFEEQDSLMNLSMIDTVIIQSTIDIKADSTFDSLALDMQGRSWSVMFQRLWKVLLNDAIHNAGYEMAFVRRMNYDQASRTVTVVVDEGRVQHVRIDPDRPINEQDVRRDLSFDDGDTITVATLKRSASNLRASDLFEDLDLWLVPAADSGLDVMIGARDKGNQMLRFGGRVDNERYGQGSADFIHQNLFGSGIRLNLHGMISSRVGVGSAALEIPRIAGSYWTTSLTGYTSYRYVWIYTDDPNQPTNSPERLRTGEYSEDRYGFRASAGRQIERFGVILAEFRYEQQRYRDRNTSTIPSFQPLGTARALVRWDDRDRIDFARSGRVIDLSLESSILNLSNGISFTKAFASAQVSVDLDPIVAIPSFLIGAADKTLPGPELFSLGGQELFYGMRQDEERGRQIIVGNLEGRYKLPFDVVFDTYLSARYDVGAVWEEPEKIRIADLQHGIGVSLGFDTPIGPALFSLGRRFYFLDNPASVAWGPVLGYFSIGARL